MLTALSKLLRKSQSLDLAEEHFWLALTHPPSSNSFQACSHVDTGDVAVIFPLLHLNCQPNCINNIEQITKNRRANYKTRELHVNQFLFFPSPMYYTLGIHSSNSSKADVGSHLDMGFCVFVLYQHSCSQERNFSLQRALLHQNFFSFSFTLMFANTMKKIAWVLEKQRCVHLGLTTVPGFDFLLEHKPNKKIEVQSV